MKGEIYLIRSTEGFTAFELPEPGKPVAIPELDIEVHCLALVSPERPAKPEKPPKEPRANKPGKVPGRKPGRPPKNRPPEDEVDIIDPVPDEQPPIPTFSGGAPLPGIGDDAAGFDDVDDETAEVS